MQQCLQVTDVRNDATEEMDVDGQVYSSSGKLYRIERFLGKGGYGEVYECRCEITKK